MVWVGRRCVRKRVGDISVERGGHAGMRRGEGSGGST